MFSSFTPRFRSTRLLAFLLIAGPACADQQNYPFKMTYHAEAGVQVVMVQNNGPAPILATVSLDNSVNVEVDHASPIIAVAKPNETLPVATVRAADAAKGVHIAVSYKYSLGDPDAVPNPAATYRLPFQDGQAIMIGQILGGKITTHTGPDSKYAVDFDIPVDTPVLAARKGVVVDIDRGNTEGGNNPRFKANHVLILHEDGTLADYAHLMANGVRVTFGQSVEAGALIGYSGNTGYSSGPHLHFAVLTNTRTPDGAAKYVSVPVNFVNAASAGTITLHQDEKLIVNYSGKLRDRAERTSANLQPAHP